VKDAHRCRDRMLRPDETIGTKVEQPPADSRVHKLRPKTARSVAQRLSPPNQRSNIAQDTSASGRGWQRVPVNPEGEGDAVACRRQACPRERLPSHRKDHRTKKNRIIEDAVFHSTPCSRAPACICPACLSPATRDGIWSGRRDSNSRPLAPHASALPGCATPRLRPKVYQVGCHGCLAFYNRRKNSRQLMRHESASSFQQASRISRSPVRNAGKIQSRRQQRLRRSYSHADPNHRAGCGHR
jgi:hypothetical protein